MRLLCRYGIRLFAVWIVLGALAAPGRAQVNFSFGIEVAPPLPPVAEPPPPPPRAGFIWSPPYWDWNDERYVRVPGRWVEVRPGHYWVPERWEHHIEERGEHWHFAPGHWEHEHEHWEHDRGHVHGHGHEHPDDR